VDARDCRDGGQCRNKQQGDAARLTPSPTQTMEPDASIMKWSFAKAWHPDTFTRATAIANVPSPYPPNDSNWVSAN
jgi:hypothetical protein